MKAATKSDWPWLESIDLLDTPVVKNLHITISEPGQQLDQPRHLFLTGRNGAGKSTVLKAIDAAIAIPFDRASQAEKLLGELSAQFPFLHASELNQLIQGTLEEMLKQVRLHPDLHGARDVFPYMFVPAERNHARKQQKFGQEANEKPNFAHQFESYLVSQQVEALLFRQQGVLDRALVLESRMKRLEEAFKIAFEDTSLELEVEAKTLGMLFKSKDGRKVRLHELADGHFSIVYLVLGIFSRMNYVAEMVGCDPLQMKGLVLIDEPELHLHLELQYLVMPLLTDLFPNLQFIVGTHSPAVISSIRHATVYDLSKMAYAPSDIAGEPFSVLMSAHFGVANEFGPEADKLLREVERIFANSEKPEEKSSKIKAVENAFKDILTPVLSEYLESLQIRLKVQAQANL